MKKRVIYWRRKKDKIVAEGTQNKKTIYLFTLPDVQNVLNSSLFTKEKIDKINEKIARLDFKDDNRKNISVEIPTININGTFEKDGKSPVDDLLEGLLQN